LREKHLTPAGRSLHRWWVAAQTAASADSFRAQAVPAQVVENAGDVALWCVNCLQYDHREPRRDDEHRLCRFCDETSRDIGGLPPRWLLDIHWQGRRASEQQVARARAELAGADTSPKGVLFAALDELAREPRMAGVTLLGALDQATDRGIAKLDAAKLLKKKRKAS
jgi:hypothetical protein